MQSPHVGRAAAYVRPDGRTEAWAADLQRSKIDDCRTTIDGLAAAFLVPVTQRYTAMTLRVLQN